MWTLLVLCSVITSHGVQGQYSTSEPDTYATYATEQPTYITDSTDVTGYTEAINETAATCGGFLFTSRGHLYSPNYPENYPNNADCIWYIRPGSRIVELEFPDVNVEADFSCRYDAIYVYDGSSVHSRLLGTLCGSQNSTFHSTGYYLTVRFKSDFADIYKGFHAEYRVVAGGSCRYNCGYQVGNCSCATGCEYRGNCCPDYKTYCQPPQPTTAPVVSCLNNCGRHLGSCSCSYSCQHYGHGCCYDYNIYCPASTVKPTTARPSCRYNCGRHLGSCSCSSSCQYYGNCCYDYNTYCHTTTVRPAATPTARPSCRYNCGRHLGSCSCSSSCQYYGNCCYDYHSYCLTPSTVRPTPTARPSCRYNCGRQLGSCSCSSSCQYYGNCCYDYHSYCPVTTDAPATAKPCGGYLHGSGSFSSPFYPSYYHDNAYCVWQLAASYGQRIFLSITDLQLENCCSCDYIAVYDGSSVNSRLMGKVCENGTLDSFHSSSNYMTVLFRSDRSVVGRGFNAEFTSSLPPSSGRVDCSSDMNIVIERSYLTSMGYDGNHLYLNDQYCKPQISRYQVIFSFPINTCGTIRKFENGRVVYTNAVRAYTSSYGEITRQSHLKLNVSCQMEKDTMVQIMYVAREHGNSSITGTGRFNGSMAFYTSSSFYYKVTEVPYKVTLNQNMYVQVNLRRDDSSLVLFLDTCVASPSPHDFHTRSYDLVRNGCPRDNTYYAYVSGSRSYARFTFQAFQFLRAHASVYLQCNVLICPASDYNSRCRRGCYKRKARDLGSAHESQTLVLGPIQLKDLEKQNEGTPDEGTPKEEDKA